MSYTFEDLVSLVANIVRECTSYEDSSITCHISDEIDVSDMSFIADSTDVNVKINGIDRLRVNCPDYNLNPESIVSEIIRRQVRFSFSESMEMPADNAEVLAVLSYDAPDIIFSHSFSYVVVPFSHGGGFSYLNMDQMVFGYAEWAGNKVSHAFVNISNEEGDYDYTYINAPDWASGIIKEHLLEGSPINGPWPEGVVVNPIKTSGIYSGNKVWYSAESENVLLKGEKDIWIPVPAAYAFSKPEAFGEEIKQELSMVNHFS